MRAAVRPCTLAELGIFLLPMGSIPEATRRTLAFSRSARSRSLSAASWAHWLRCFSMSFHSCVFCADCGSALAFHWKLTRLFRSFNTVSRARAASPSACRRTVARSSKPDGLMRGTLGRGLLCAGELAAEPADRAAGGVPGVRCCPSGALDDEDMSFTGVSNLV